MKKIRPYALKKAGQKQAKKTKTQETLDSQEKLFSQLFNEMKPKYKPTGQTRADMLNLTVRTPKRVRENVHATAANLGMKADLLMEILFATPHGE